MSFVDYVLYLLVWVGGDKKVYSLIHSSIIIQMYPELVLVDTWLLDDFASPWKMSLREISSPYLADRERLIVFSHSSREGISQGSTVSKSANRDRPPALSLR